MADSDTTSISNDSDTTSISNEELEAMIGQKMVTPGDTKVVEDEDLQSEKKAGDTDSEMHEIEANTGDSNAKKTEREIVYVGADDYKNPADVIWFTLCGKAFPTKMVNPFVVMKLAEAQNSGDEVKAMVATLTLLRKMIPAKYRDAFEEHLTDSDYDDDELTSVMEKVMGTWANANQAQQVHPLAKQNVTSGQSISQQGPGTLKVVSLDRREVTSRPLTEEEKKDMKERLVNKDTIGPLSPS